MAGDALLDRGPSRLSVFSDADDLFDNQMADFSPEEEARMLTAMLYKKYVDVPSEADEIDLSVNNSTPSWSNGFPSTFDEMETTALPMQSKSIASPINGDDAAESDRRTSDQADQENLHMTIDMLNQKMDEQLSSFDAKAMKSLKRRTLQHKALNDELSQLPDTPQVARESSLVAMANEQLQAMAPLKLASEGEADTPGDDDYFDNLVFSSEKAQRQQAEKAASEAKATPATAPAPAPPVQSPSTETVTEDGQRVSAFPFRGRSDSEIDVDVDLALNSNNRKQSAQSIGGWMNGSDGRGQGASSPALGTPVKQRGTIQPGMSKVRQAPRRKKVLPHRPSSLAGQGKPGSGMEPTGDNARPRAASPPPTGDSSRLRAASPPPADPTRRESEVSALSGGSVRRRSKVETQDGTPKKEQPLSHMDCVALPMSSPLASMASLNGPPKANTATSKRRSVFRIGKGKNSKITKDMIGLPNEFKHVSHTAPQDVGPLLSALHVADLGTSSI